MLENDSKLCGYYINLENRPDRKNHFEQNIKKYDMFREIKRMPACENVSGAIGCAMSHVEALKLAKKNHSDQKFIAVFEDDFCILNENHYHTFEKSFQKIKNMDDWDVIAFTPYTPRQILVNQFSSEMKNHNFKRILNTQTATGYVFKYSFIDILLNNFEESVQLLINGECIFTSTVDQHWKKLQTVHNFYYFDQVFAGQLEGYSNIEKREVNYNNYFINNHRNPIE